MYCVMKRAADVAICVLLLPVVGPCFLLIALLMRMTSPGPLFYQHRRVGQHGEYFRMWKIRTMCVDNEARLREHLASDATAQVEWEKNFKLKDDPRVSRVGRMLRKTSLDELPQIWNVLAGEMSLIGPRPIVEEEIARYDGRFLYYAAAKPGVTGLWQVSGRSDCDYASRTKLDEQYVREWTPWMDVKILARTVVAVGKCRGAY